MKLIVGLGNPGTKYAGTRHNVGFSVIVGLADKYNIELSEKKHKAIYGRGMIEGEKVILAMPQTFMNLSGESVRELVDYYKCDPSDVIVAYDDIDLAVGKLRIREKGSAGGHNGIKSIIQHLGGQEFPRIKVGVGEKPVGYDLADYVSHTAGDDATRAFCSDYGESNPVSVCRLYWEYIYRSSVVYSFLEHLVDVHGIYDSCDNWDARCEVSWIIADIMRDLD